jgi:Ca-activated chloride channel family protein
MKRLIPLAAVTLLALPVAADVGVLIPSSESNQPDPSVLVLRSMDIHVTLVDRHAEVRMQQVFQNLTANVVEAKYTFPLSEDATVKEFALWEGDDRMPGTIVEKQQGKKLYEKLTRRNVDPGLLETADDKKDQGDFQVRVAPIPGYGTSRIEIVYETNLTLSSLGYQLALPLTPRRWQEQTAGSFSVTIDGTSAAPLAKVSAAPDDWFKGQNIAAGATSFHLTHTGKDVAFTSDVEITMTIAPPSAPLAASIRSYRDTRPVKDVSALGTGKITVDPHGYFVATGVFQPPAAGRKQRKRDIVVVLDTSLSMQWNKLDTAMSALEYFLGKQLGPDDRFDIIVFDDQVTPWKPALQPAGAASVDDALKFVRAATLAGGSDVIGALTQAVTVIGQDPRAGADKEIILISDGHPTAGELRYKELGTLAGKLWKAAKGGAPRLFVLGVGDDVNKTLLTQLVGDTGGAYAAVGDVASVGFAMTSFFDKLSLGVWREVKLALPAAAQVDMVYPGTTLSFDGSDVTFFGRYATPQPSAQGAITAVNEDGQTVTGPINAPLTADDTSMPWIGRGWASQRVADLLDRIRTDGEKPEWVNEVIGLAKRWKLVTPYTSFIAAPRSQLRPRDFQPGDPVLRVKTGPDIVAVTAVFPFGLEKALGYVQDEDLWETRFLAPTWMVDGTYPCTLILTDRQGVKIREEKTFVIDSAPPEVKLSLGADTVHPGETLALTAHASGDTRTLRARIDDGVSVDLRWSNAAKASVGKLTVPADLAPGPHEVHVVAEDFAHNTTIETVPLTVKGL